MGDQLSLYFPKKNPDQNAVSDDEKKARRLIRTRGAIRRRGSTVVPFYEWVYGVIVDVEYVHAMDSVQIVLSDGSEFFVYIRRRQELTAGVLEWVHLLLEEMLYNGKIKPRKSLRRKKA